MNNKYLISELARVIDASETTGLNKNILNLINTSGIYKETPMWLSAALSRSGDFVTLTTEDIREVKLLLDAQ